MPARLGLVVNPIAGMGGRVGLHGTDGMLEEAVRRGARPVAPHRARRALAALAGSRPDVELLVAEADAARIAREPEVARHGWPLTVVDGPHGEGAAATVHAAAALAGRVDLLAFVGGDGTARDVLEGLGGRHDVVVLGVPAGVKMHSAVFATTPEAAGGIAARHLSRREGRRTTLAEVVDEDPATGETVLYGTMTTPRAADVMQGAKQRSPREDAEVAAALGRQVAAEMVPGCTYLLGPGTTVAAVSTALGLPATLRGVDVVRDGRLVLADATESQLLDVVGPDVACELVLGVVGGQGFLLGRGNQQISPEVLEAVGPGRTQILATPAKIAALDPPVLRVDLGLTTPVTTLTGHRRVRTGPRDVTVLRIVT